ncbi:hypothetical protein OSB04_023560 [Centaurea solstitialis]|uniref:cyclin-dependent kinase n=1 Tax=Centaurea solstitialis TaxID=347529 RepID=A0AA38SK40_9ASTR|nr:hypothetical protein OSB04_023560 [Centaurea solstitialis]
MEKYQRIEVIGRGSYGIVWKAINKQTGEVVAMKKLVHERFHSMEECMNLREVKALRMMKDHPNVVNLKEIIKENNVLFLVFEYMEDGSLYDHMMRRKKPFSENEIKNLCFQVFQGLAYMHDTVGYFHRDLKPANLLVSKDVIKIADLGQAREINGRPPYTDYVTTRWYRAPEVFLYAPIHDSAVDMWAMGAIMVELFTLRPLFQGSSSGEVMQRICGVIGSPTETTWELGLYLADMINYRFPEYPGVDLSALLPSASPAAIHLITKLLSWNPVWRPTAEEVLEHPFFYGCVTSSSQKMVFNQELLKDLAISEICGSERSTTTDEDLVNTLPENPFEFM